MQAAYVDLVIVLNDQHTQCLRIGQSRNHGIRYAPSNSRLDGSD